MAYSHAYEFRTTCVRFLVNDRIIRNIARIIEGAGMYALQAFNPTEILHPEFFYNKDAIINEKGLIHLKTIVAPWVSQCIVR